MGSIITFYSYKGGVGRTMALANIATLLASWQKKVLVIDWDLEAPGVENFFYSSDQLAKVQSHKGLVELLTDLRDRKKSAATWESLVIDVPVRRGTRLSLLTAGARTPGYFERVRRLDVKSFYDRNEGGYIVEKLRNDWKTRFDFVLIDSRTGITDIGGICTIQLPDILTLVFSTTNQSLYGAINVANRAATERQKLPFDRAQMPVFPLPSKFDTQTEHKISRKWLSMFEDAVSPFYNSWLPTTVKPREFLEVTKIPYIPFFSFGESLPVLEAGTRDPAGLGYAYETAAGVLGNELQNADLLLLNRDEFILSARFASPIPRIPLQTVPAQCVLFTDVVSVSSTSGIMPDKDLSKFQKTAAEAINANNGTVAMSSGDSILVAFSDAASALHCALLIQETLLVRKPIFVGRGPLRTRTSIHKSSRAKKEALTNEFTLQAAVNIANKAKGGQIIISEEARRSLDGSIDSVEFVRLDEVEMPNDRGDFVFQPLYEVVAITFVKLTKAERDALFQQPPSTKLTGGFQAFLVKLQKHVQPDSNELKLTIEDRERIARYAFDYRSGGWQARLRKIFGRTLGATLGRERDGLKKETFVSHP
jgi:MinD-like ATPase involved in chromosome partitioning or flagellar assembly/class 3 adenylate cyclase